MSCMRNDPEYINDIDKWINIFYGQVLLHETDEEKERANIVIDYISFLEKQYRY